jgi:hypothetical protein
MTSFAKIYASILDSSVWSEDPGTRVVWLTMLVMCDAEGFVEASVQGIARRANVPVEVCRRSMELFQAPDPDSKDPDHEGRRVERVEGGWLVLNYAKYREKRTPAQIRAAERQRRFRERQSVTRNACNALSRTEAEAEAEAHETQKEKETQEVVGRVEEVGGGSGGRPEAEGRAKEDPSSQDPDPRSSEGGNGPAGTYHDELREFMRQADRRRGA